MSTVHWDAEHCSTLQTIINVILFICLKLETAKSFYSLRKTFCQTSNISGTLVGNKIVDHSDWWNIACLRCSNYIFILDKHLASVDCAETTARWDEKHLGVWIWCNLSWRFDISDTTTDLFWPLQPWPSCHHSNVSVWRESHRTTCDVCGCLACRFPRLLMVTVESWWLEHSPLGTQKPYLHIKSLH